MALVPAQARDQLGAALGGFTWASASFATLYGVVSVMLAFRVLPLGPEVKFLLVGVVAVPVCFAVGYAAGPPPSGPGPAGCPLCPGQVLWECRGTRRRRVHAVISRRNTHARPLDGWQDWFFGFSPHTEHPRVRTT